MGTPPSMASDSSPAPSWTHLQAGRSPVTPFAHSCACPHVPVPPLSRLHHVPSGLSCHAAAVPDSCPINIEE